MQQGLGGYGNINARMPMPVGGGATAGSPVGALMQKLLAWKAQGQQPQGQQPPPEFERGMADMLGLNREQGSPIVGKPAPEDQQQNGGGSGGIMGMLADHPLAPQNNPMADVWGKHPLAKPLMNHPLLGLMKKHPLESWLGR